MAGKNIRRNGPIIPDAVYYQDGREDTDVAIFEEYDGVELTPDEVSFVNYYVGEARYNATKAWSMVRGRTADRAHASRVMHRPHIQKAIKYRLEAAGATAEAALAELSDVAFAEFHDFIDVKMKNGEIISVRMDLSSKVRALETIVKVHGLLEGNNQVNNGIVININAPGITEDELA